MGITTTKSNRFRARFSHKGKTINVGTFKTRLKACQQLRIAQNRLITQLPYKPDIDFTFWNKPLARKLTLKDRLLNAYHSFRSNTKSKK